MADKDGFEKVEDTVVKFEKAGDQVSGKLVGIEDGKKFGNKVYKILSAGKTLTVFSSTVLETKMSSAAEGDDVKIVYLGEIPNKNKGLNAIRNFDVYIKRA